jgi:TRAP-type C4-dicarboxylate transport system permease small subunit
MKGFSKAVHFISRIFNIVAGASLTFLMILTVLDIALRGFRRPIVGTYELVAFAGAVVIGFSMPLTSWFKSHVYVDSLIAKFSQKTRNVFNVATRVLVIGLFVVIGWNLIEYGMTLKKSGEVSLTLQVPFYPVAFGLGICCFAQCLVMVSAIVKIFGGEYE